MITKPMLAGKLDADDNIRYPILVTQKLDGIRCLVIDGHAVTRKFKLIPNRHIRAKIEQYCPTGFDGEIMSGKLYFNDLQSLVMKEDGEPDFEYHVFDYVMDSIDKGYKDRIIDLDITVASLEQKFIVAVIPKLVTNHDEFFQWEETFLKEGYEGIMLRSLNGPYKCGRSTMKEGYLLKSKRFKDSEAVILGVEELMHNANKKEVDELGYTKRSKKKANLQPTDKLGALLVRDIVMNIEFKVSTGMTDKQRVEYWKDKENLIGKLVKYKYQGIGKAKPRFPVFLGFRDPRDMS